MQSSFYFLAFSKYRPLCVIDTFTEPSSITVLFSLSPQRALDILGFSAEEQQAILRVIASVLKLGNVTFSPVNNIDGSEGCVVDNEYGKSLVLVPFFFSQNIRVQ